MPPDQFIDKLMMILRRVFAAFSLHFSHSVHSDVGCRLLGLAVEGQLLLVVEGSGGGGDAGSLTPRCSVIFIS